MTGRAIHRRWLRLSLWTMVVAIGVFGAWLGYELNWLYQRRHLLAHGWCGIHGNSPPGLLWLVTDDGHFRVWKFGDLSPEDIQDVERVKSLFPEAAVEQ